jgi:hypothetical protein
MLTMLALNLGMSIPRDKSTGKIDVAKAKAQLSSWNAARRKNNFGSGTYEIALAKAMKAAYTLVTQGRRPRPFLRSAIQDTETALADGEYDTFEDVVEGLMENIRTEYGEDNPQNDDASSLLMGSFKAEYSEARRRWTSARSRYRWTCWTGRGDGSRSSTWPAGPT